jgi:hypothetical protein
MNANFVEEHLMRILLYISVVGLCSLMIAYFASLALSYVGRRPSSWLIRPSSLQLLIAGLCFLQLVIFLALLSSCLTYMRGLRGKSITSYDTTTFNASLNYANDE